MKYLRLISLCFLLQCFSLQVFSEFHLCERQYIEIEDVYLAEEGISIARQSGDVVVPVLYCDDMGWYFKNFKKKGSCSEGKWECQICRYCNPNYTLYCGVCWN